MNKKIEELYNKIDGLNNIIDLQTLEISKLKGILQEIYERAINTNITSLDLRDYLIVILGDKENE